MPQQCTDVLTGAFKRAYTNYTNPEKDPGEPRRTVPWLNRVEDCLDYDIIGSYRDSRA